MLYVQMMTPAEALRAAKAKIQKPDRWCRGAYARDGDGDAVDSRSRPAVSFCAIGATRAVRDEDGVEDTIQYLGKAAWIVGNHINIPHFNDAPTTKHRHILGLFDWAIALAERDEA